MRSFLNPPTDERLQIAHYRAGFYAFYTMGTILLILGFVFLWLPEDVDPILLFPVLFFPGTAVYLVLLWRSGWFTYVRETANASRHTKRLAVVELALRTVLFTVCMGLVHYYTIAPIGDSEPSVTGSALFALLNGVLWGTTMGLLLMKKVRSKDDGKQTTA